MQELQHAPLSDVLRCVSTGICTRREADRREQEVAEGNGTRSPKKRSFHIDTSVCFSCVQRLKGCTISTSFLEEEQGSRSPRAFPSTPKRRNQNWSNSQESKNSQKQAERAHNQNGGAAPRRQCRKEPERRATDVVTRDYRIAYILEFGLL